MKLFKEYASVAATANPDTIQIRFGEINTVTKTPALDDCVFVLPQHVAVEIAQIIIKTAAATQEKKAELAAVPSDLSARLQ